MKYLYIFLITIIVLSCSKRKSKKWFVEKSNTSIGCLIQVIDTEESFFKEPLIFDPNCNGFVFIESQLVERLFNESIRQTFFIELPIDTNNFYFQNVDLVSNLKFYVSNTYNNTYYRSANGWIKGEYKNGTWVIDFDLYYGGIKKNRFHIKKGAHY
jgi:hypothetical protein